jgi:hypothetical protein
MLKDRRKIRSLMLLVALSALAFGSVAGGLRLKRLSVRYRAQAQLYAAKSASLKSMHLSQEGFLEADRQARGAPKGEWDAAGFLALEELAKNVEYHAYMAKKYEYAASHPWETPPIDPREPGPARNRPMATSGPKS